METIVYSENGVSLNGLLVRPNNAPVRAGVLVCHEGPGRGDHIRRRLEMLAELGYAAFALDIYGEGSPVETDGEKMFGRLRPWLEKREGLRARALAGLNAFKNAAETKVTFAIGYCFGGTVALELARMGAPLAGVVSFHGGLKATIPAKPSVVKAHILSCVGTEDPSIPLEDRSAFEAEMIAAGAQFQTLLFSGTLHSFTNTDTPSSRPGFGYNAWADQQSWSAMQSFFNALETNEPAVT
jgi:dienelactone hydrolase